MQSAKEKDSEATFTFNDSGVMLAGVWNKDHGKADTYIDGKPDCPIDAFYWVADVQNLRAFLYHNITLDKGEHTVRIALTGDKTQKRRIPNLTLPVLWYMINHNLNKVENNLHFNRRKK